MEFGASADVYRDGLYLISLARIVELLAQLPADAMLNFHGWSGVTVLDAAGRYIGYIDIFHERIVWHADEQTADADAIIRGSLG